MGEEDNHKKPRWLTSNKEFYRKFKYERERLKTNMTAAELILWEHLKNKKLGVKFRRQHVIENYIPDFVALSIKLIIEVDGGIHIKYRKEDAIRTKWLNFIGYSVIRFKNEEVENQIERVLEKIKEEIQILTSPNLSKGEE
jgi:very-short-patch-repair endonuclease